MKKQTLNSLTTIFLVILLVSCASGDESGVYFFEGDIQTLLLQEADVPSEWQFYRASNAPLNEEVIANAGVTYASRPTLNHMTTVISHDVGTYKQQEVAIERFDYSYEDYFNPSVEPPQKYRYKSPIADEFEIICATINDLDGLFIGYHCLYSARYGNVISDLTVYIEREDGIKPKTANLLSWIEVERLLKLIDDKIEGADFLPNRQPYAQRSS